MDVDVSPFGITYLKFDLRGVSTRITSAVLTVSCSNKSSDGGTVYPVLDSSWVEGDRTGGSTASANGPGLKWIDVDLTRDNIVDGRDGSPFVPDFTRPLGSFGPVVAGQSHSVDVTAALQGGPGLYTLAIRSASSDGATYDSRHATNLARRPRLRLTISPETVPPAACTNPVVIPAVGGTFNGTTAGASSLEGACGGAGSPERVFQWTPATSGTATVLTCGAATTFDTVVHLREGACDRNEIACSNDVVGCGVADGTDNASLHGSSVTATVTAGTPYFIVVDGFQGASGNFTFTVIPPS
jgi:hypothetical protein